MGRRVAGWQRSAACERRLQLKKGQCAARGFAGRSFGLEGARGYGSGSARAGMRGQNLHLAAAEKQTRGIRMVFPLWGLRRWRPIGHCRLSLYQVGYY